MASQDVDGIEVHFERVGHGPPVVLLHGGMSNSRDWRPQLQALADEFTVLAWDAPGCGRSDDPPADWGLAGYADCLAGLLERQRIIRPRTSSACRSAAGSRWSSTGDIPGSPTP